MRYGGSSPKWTAVLLAAEQWGCPPWQIYGREDAATRMRWLERWLYWQSQRDRATEERLSGYQQAGR